MRRQGGTTALRALVYMDEVFGYFPPHPANPPTKRPLLTLLKQARAQGVGVVLATQNPVDLDYKGLANMGTWLVGTLQTQQDRERLLGGLAGAGLEAGAAQKLLAATKKRVFLLHDVHRKRPELVQSRWAMSYLRGPLTRDEISRLMKDRAPAAASERLAEASRKPAAAPVLPPPFRHLYLARHGGQMAEAHVLVKYAARYKGERRGDRRAGVAARGRERRSRRSRPSRSRVDEKAIARGGARRAPLRRAAGLARRRRRARARARAQGAPAGQADARRVPRPGDGRELAAAARRARRSRPGSRPRAAGTRRRRSRQKLEKKRSDLAVREQEVAGRRQEKWLAVGSAVLKNIGLLMGKKRSVTGVSSVLTKNRMEDTAEARLEALRSEVAALEEQQRAGGRDRPRALRGARRWRPCAAAWRCCARSSCGCTDQGVLTMPQQFLLHLPDGTQYGPIDRRDARGLAARGPAARGHARVARGRARVGEPDARARGRGAGCRRRPRAAPAARAAGRAGAQAPAAAARGRAASAAAPTPAPQAARRAEDAAPLAPAGSRPARRPADAPVDAHARLDAKAAAAREAKARSRGSRPPTSAACCSPASGSRSWSLLVAGMFALLRPFLARRQAIAEVRRYALAERRVEDPGSGLVVELPAGWLALRNENPYVVRPGARLALAQPAKGVFGAVSVAVRPAMMDDLDAHLAELLQQRLSRQPSQREGARSEVQLGRGRGRMVRTTWEDDLVPMQGATVAWADGYNLFSLEAWAPAAAGDSFAAELETICKGLTARGAGRRPGRGGRRAAGGGGAGTFEGRAASPGCGADEPGPQGWTTCRTRRCAP